MSWKGRVERAAEYLKTLKSSEEIKILLKEKEEKKLSAFEQSIGKRVSKAEEFPEGETTEKKVEKAGGSPLYFGGMPNDDSTNEKYFAKKLKSILRDNLSNREVSGKRTGDLDHKKLYKIKTSDKLFSEKEDLKDKEYNLVILVDCSGSMQGANKIGYAFLFLRKLYKILYKNCNLAIIGFNQITEIAKSFKEKIEPEELDRRIEQVLRQKLFRPPLTSGNHDHIAIKKAEELLSQVKKGRRLIMVLSDGQPACDCWSRSRETGCGHEGCASHSDLKRLLKEAVKRVQKKGIETIGIGVLKQRDEFYNYGASVSNIKELYSITLRELSKIIKRRR